MQRPFLVQPDQVIVGCQRQSLGLESELHRRPVVRIQQRRLDRYLHGRARVSQLGTGNALVQLGAALPHIALQGPHLLALQRTAQQLLLGHHPAFE